MRLDLNAQDSEVQSNKLPKPTAIGRPASAVAGCGFGLAVAWLMR